MIIFKPLRCLLGPSMSSFTCGICFESLPNADKFRKKNCSHSYCTHCIARYIASAAAYRRSIISCPSPGCKRILRPLSCRKFVAADVFVQWCDNLCDYVLSSLRASYCPYPDCSAPVLNECSNFVTRALCPQCRRLFCFKCRVEWHEGFDCKGVRKKEEDVLFDRLVMRQGWRRCPWCRRGVDRVGGCRIIQCRLVHFFVCSSCFLFILQAKGVFVLVNLE